MSSYETNLCYELMYDHYGKIVADVAKFLCQSWWQPLRSIVKETHLKNDQVSCRCSSMQHSVVLMMAKMLKRIKIVLLQLQEVPSYDENNFCCLTIFSLCQHSVLLRIYAFAFFIVNCSRLWHLKLL